MRNHFLENQKILASVGFTPVLIEYTQYELGKLTKAIKEAKYGNAKTGITMANKTQLQALVMTLLLENVELAVLIKTHVEKTVNESEY